MPSTRIMVNDNNIKNVIAKFDRTGIDISRMSERCEDVNRGGKRHVGMRMTCTILFTKKDLQRDLIDQSSYSDRSASLKSE